MVHSYPVTFIDPSFSISAITVGDIVLATFAHGLYSAAPPPQAPLPPKLALPVAASLEALAGVLVWGGGELAGVLRCRGGARSQPHWVQGLDATSKGSRERFGRGGSGSGGMGGGGSLAELSAAMLRCTTDLKYRTRLCQHRDSSRGTFCPRRKEVPENPPPPSRTHTHTMLMRLWCDLFPSAPRPIRTGATSRIFWWSSA